MTRATRATLVFAGMTAVGLVALGVAWWGVSGTLDVSSQLAFAVSGGAGGLALVVTGTALLSAHLGRSAAADERDALDRVLTRAAALAADHEARTLATKTSIRTRRSQARRRRSTASQGEH